MAPAVASRGAAGEAVRAPAMQAMMMEAMGKVRRHVEDNFDYVGDRFAAEARSIHEGAAEARGIFGEATPSEVKALATQTARSTQEIAQHIAQVCAAPPESLSQQWSGSSRPSVRSTPSRDQSLRLWNNRVRRPPRLPAMSRRPLRQSMR